LEKRASESDEEQPERKPAMRPANPKEATLRSLRVVRGFLEGMVGLRGKLIQNAGLQGQSDGRRLTLLVRKSNDPMVAEGSTRFGFGIVGERFVDNASMPG
jgi:hypothetical protein